MERRLAAILAADVAGYSRQMAVDETGTLARLNHVRTEIIEPKVDQFRGHIVGSAGDSLLVEFNSAVSAVECAVKTQDALASWNEGLSEENRVIFRMGINLGDVIADRDTIFGDGVNIAARLEKLAEPGGVCVAHSVFDQVKGKLPYAYDDLGAQQVHNIPQPVHAYRVKIRTLIESAQKSPSLPDKPSIAVLPFNNMSGDPDQEYFADGIVEEIITALSRFHGLFVIARNSSFTYKGRAVDVKQAGRELGVRYVLEGSVRKAGSRVRITAQLIDSSSGVHLWADRYEGAFEDIFDLQDQVMSKVVGAIAPQIERAEIERTKRKPPENLDAYDQYLRGMEGFHKFSREGSKEALSHLYRATELDPSYAAAYSMIARIYVQRNAGDWAEDQAHEVAETEKVAIKAVELDRNDAVVLANAGFAFCDILGLVEEGDAMIDRALELNPNLAWIWLYSSWTKTSLGQPEIAIEHIQRALRLSPNDPLTFSFHAAKAWAEFFAGRFSEAYASAESAIRQRPGMLLYTCIAACSAALAERHDDARRIVTRMLQANPSVNVAKASKLIPLRRAEDNARWTEGLRKAGLPE
ncbi:adenylate/guanylate cyclase domain-containing protein [Taklimakanibacter deserti]|uniref:adenylate/guanylate cyclase domain-containing protein n=1 Tax=Taklimakanibacter deserti TaxID=2267839 RepID=UPI0034D62309